MYGITSSFQKVIQCSGAQKKKLCVLVYDVYNHIDYRHNPIDYSICSYIPYTHCPCLGLHIVKTVKHKKTWIQRLLLFPMGSPVMLYFHVPIRPRKTSMKMTVELHENSYGNCWPQTVWADGRIM